MHLLCRVQEDYLVNKVLRDHLDYRYTACYLLTRFKLQSFRLEYL